MALLPEVHFISPPPGSLTRREKEKRVYGKAEREGIKERCLAIAANRLRGDNQGIRNAIFRPVSCTHAEGIIEGKEALEVGTA